MYDDDETERRRDDTCHNDIAFDERDTGSQGMTRSTTVRSRRAYSSVCRKMQDQSVLWPKDDVRSRYPKLATPETLIKPYPITRQRQWIRLKGYMVVKFPRGDCIRCRTKIWLCNCQGKFQLMTNSLSTKTLRVHLSFVPTQNSLSQFSASSVFDSFRTFQESRCIDGVDGSADCEVEPLRMMVTGEKVCKAISDHPKRHRDFPADYFLYRSLRGHLIAAR